MILRSIKGYEELGWSTYHRKLKKSGGKPAFLTLRLSDLL
jgi:hypothetical protein